MRQRIFIAIIISISVGVLEGLGLTMFLPLLQMVNDSTQIDVDSLGKMGFVLQKIKEAGIELSLFNILGLMVVFFIFKGVFKLLNGLYRTYLNKKFIQNIRKNLINNFNKIKFDYYINSDIGRIQNTLSGEVERGSRAFLEYSKTTESAILIIVYMGFAFFVDYKFSLLVTIGGVLTNSFYKILYKITKTTSKEFSVNSHNYQAQIIQYIANFKYLKATGLLNAYANKLQKTIVDIEKNRKKMGVLNAILEAFREPAMIAVIALAIIIQVSLINASLGALLISLLFFYRALSAMVTMQSSWNRFLSVSGSLETIKGFQTELKLNEESRGTQIIENFETAIKLENISQSYKKVEVLKNIDLTIFKNETIAVVGESGSGKTTLINLIAGLMPVTSGKIYIDSVNSTLINANSYQQRLGYITQEPVIFNDTVFNNITFWDIPNKENMARFESAMQKAALGEFIGSLEHGSNAIIGFSGVNLSGGQKQRISIARELYKDIDILIMDEATSSLDSETEKIIRESIDKLKGKYTILIVAHRLSTIKKADRIIVLNNGKINSIGSYTELVSKNVVFKKMVELQEL